MNKIVIIEETDDPDPILEAEDDIDDDFEDDLETEAAETEDEYSW